MMQLSGPRLRRSNSRVRFFLQLFSSLAVLALLLAARPVRAEEPDEAFLPIYTQIQDAESLEASGQTAKALTKYQDALGALKTFQRNHPDWNAKVVNTRLNRLSEKIAALTEARALSGGAKTNAAAGGASSSAPAGSAEGAAKLLEPGAEPRTVLRLHPKAGDKQTVEMTAQIGTEGVKIPAIKLSLDVTVKTVSPEGTITYEMVITDAGVAEEPGAASPMAQMLKGPLGSMKGMSGTGTVSDRGVSKGFNVKGPSNADPASRQLVEQMKGMLSELVVGLPEAAVGAGAKWEVRKVSKAQGFPVNQTETYELVSMESDRLTVKNSRTESAANQKVQGPGGAMAKLEVTKMSGTGTVDRTVDLGQLIPLEYVGKEHVESTITMGAPQKQTMTQKADLEVHLQAK